MCVWDLIYFIDSTWFLMSNAGPQNSSLVGCRFSIYGCVFALKKNRPQIVLNHQNSIIWSNSIWSTIDSVEFVCVAASCFEIETLFF